MPDLPDSPQPSPQPEDRRRVTALTLLSQQVQEHSGAIASLDLRVQQLRLFLERQQERSANATEAAVQSVFDKRLAELQAMIRAEVASHVGQVTQQIQTALVGGTEEVSKMIQATVARQLQDIQDRHSAEMHRLLDPLLAEREAARVALDKLEAEKKVAAEARDEKIAQLRVLAIGVFVAVIINYFHNLSGDWLNHIPHGNDILGVGSIGLVLVLVLAFRKPPTGAPPVL